MPTKTREDAAESTRTSEAAQRLTGSESGQSDENIDEQFRALLEGLRTSLPGVQVLFGFLLVAPFQADFAEYDTLTLASFSIAFFSSAIASLLLIAPSVHQRLRAPASGMRRRSKRHLVIATWLSIVGTVAMGIAIGATVFLVANFVFEALWVSGATAAIMALLGWSWFYLPVVAFRR